MFDITSVADYLGVWGGMISSIIVIGSALGWVAKKFYLDPKDKRKEEQERNYQAKMISVAQEQNAPFRHSIEKLNHAVDSLNKLLEESQRDRVALHKISDANTLQLGKLDDEVENHEVRISILEDRAGIKKVEYKEVYGKEKDL